MDCKNIKINKFSRWLFEIIHIIGFEMHMDRPDKSKHLNFFCIFLQSPHQSRHEKCFKCWKDFFCYFNALETRNLGIEKENHRSGGKFYKFKFRCQSPLPYIMFNKIISFFRLGLGCFSQLFYQIIKANESYTGSFDRF